MGLNGGAYVCAAGGTGAGAQDLREYVSGRRAPLSADAAPVALRDSVGAVAPSVSRMASRFAQLAVLGAASCLRPLPRPLHSGTRVYLGTGLGDVAATDALYYCVMPPNSEAPPPARFATSGNNMAAFFVAKHAELTARNLTVSQAELSFEAALDLAVSDLSAGATDAALVGGVDETTVPREFYTRRYAVAPEQFIGEGSGWLLLRSTRAGALPGPDAIGAISGVRLLPPPRSLNTASWVNQVMAAQPDVGTYAEHGLRLTLLAGCGTDGADIAALAARLPESTQHSYLPYTGRFPTAAALGIAGLFLPPESRAQACLHVNRDASGRSALVWFQIFGSNP
jgi:hypothetical protein